MLQMNNDQKWFEQMHLLLYYNVPRFIKHIGQRGGVSAEEMQWMKCQEDSPDYPEGMLSRGDEYLLYPKDEETFKKGLFVLVKALAIMAFIPGGVRFGGLHFSFDVVNFVCEDGSEKS
jgi:hypothetical protein